MTKDDNPATITLGSNAISITGGQKMKKTQKNFEITCYSCNKKTHFAKDYTKPKNWL